MTKKITYLLLTIIAISCSSSKEIDARWAMNRGAGKMLKDKTVIYNIFVDTKTTHYWTGFDIKSTKDSLNKCVKWLTSQADENGQDLELELMYYGTTSKPTFRKNIPYDHIYEAFADGEYAKESKLNKWVNGILKKVNKSIILPNGEKLPRKPKITAGEAIVKKIKKLRQAENVTINIMVNNYFVSDVSAIFNSMTDEDTEFIISSGKDPYSLSTLILSAFGAQSLADGAYNKYKVKDIQLAQNDFPNDIMVKYFPNIDNAEISEYTAYLIGWKETIRAKYVDLFKIEPKKKLLDDSYK